jgi:hypothetical protein
MIDWEDVAAALVVLIVLIAPWLTLAWVAWVICGG